MRQILMKSTSRREITDPRRRRDAAAAGNPDWMKTARERFNSPVKRKLEERYKRARRII